ncbi:MAG: class I SAM-dependent methyltransferase [Candidatus Margulisiibacteriota bacterium]
MANKFDSLTNLFICPVCKAEISLAGQNQLVCKNSHVFNIHEDIPIFAPNPPSQFYEEWTYKMHLELSARAPFIDKIMYYLSERLGLSLRREKFLKKALNGKKGFVLDVGCGAGRSFYRQIGPVIGVDIAMSALKDSRKIYPLVAQADVLNLPFQDNIFDFVVSTDMIGHIPAAEKDQLLKEMCRVLKPGGIMAHVIEADANNLFYNFAKRDKDLFHKYFVIEISGHFGLERAAETLNRFRALGLKEEKVELIYDLFVPLYDFLRFYGEGYQKKYPVVKFLALMVKMLMKNRYVAFIADIKLGIFATIFEKFRDIRCAQDFGVVYRKAS